jgi:hypothetical protein
MVAAPGINGRARLRVGRAAAPEPIKKRVMHSNGVAACLKAMGTLRVVRRRAPPLRGGNPFCIAFRG